MDLWLLVPLLVGVHVVALVPGGLWMRAWMRRQPDPVAAHHRFCGGVMALGFLLLALGPMSGALTHRASTGFATFPAGLLIIASMMLKRRQLARMMADRIRPGTV